MHSRENGFVLIPDTGLLEQFRCPMLLVDERRSILFRNAAASRCLQSGSWIVERRGQVACSDCHSEARLRNAIEALNLGSASPGAQPRSRVAVDKPGGAGRVMVFIFAIRPSAPMRAVGYLPVALLVFQDPAQCSEPDPHVVAEAFDLTPTEAAVTVQVSSGLSPKQIARSAGTSVSTVRAHLKAVFAKTGATRQSELVHLVAVVTGFGMLRTR